MRGNVAGCARRARRRVAGSLDRLRRDDLAVVVHLDYSASGMVVTSVSSSMPMPQIDNVTRRLDLVTPFILQLAAASPTQVIGEGHHANVLVLADRRASGRGRVRTAADWRLVLVQNLNRDVVEFPQLVGAVTQGIQHRLALQVDVGEGLGERVEPHRAADLHVVVQRVAQGSVGAQVAPDHDLVHDVAHVMAGRRSRCRFWLPRCSRHGPASLRAGSIASPAGSRWSVDAVRRAPAADGRAARTMALQGRRRRFSADLGVSWTKAGNGLLVAWVSSHRLKP